MAKPTYEEVQATITALVNAHAKSNDGYEYPATTGNLSAVLGLLIAGELSRKGAFEHLQDTVKRITAEAK